LGFQDNDLWIAALAERYELTLVTSDSDFKRLSQVGNFAIENWLVD